MKIFTTVFAMLATLLCAHPGTMYPVSGMSAHTLTKFYDPLISEMPVLSPVKTIWTKNAVVNMSGNKAAPTITDDESSQAVTGLWLSSDKRGIIQIYKHDDRFFGRLVWLREPEDDQGNPILDSENPDPSKRDRPILGLEMVFGLEYTGGEWRNGEIYDPESGNTYSARLRLDGYDRMDLRGFIRLPIFGRTESWTRVDSFPEDGEVWSGMQ